jgi:hypothetical protein
MPESIPSLGIVQKLDPRLILRLLTGVDTYFLITFFISWLADYWTWQRKLRRLFESVENTTLGEAIELAAKKQNSGSMGSNGYIR